MRDDTDKISKARIELLRSCVLAEFPAHAQDSLTASLHHAIVKWIQVLLQNPHLLDQTIRRISRAELYRQFLLPWGLYGKTELVK